MSIETVGWSIVYPSNIGEVTSALNASPLATVAIYESNAWFSVSAKT